MATYDIPQFPMKRLRYFNDQFLSEQDFIDDQAAHLAHERSHLRALCVAGVCEGLTVTFTAATTPVSIAPGVAVDKLGRLIAIDAAASGPAPSGLTSGTYVLYIKYNEAASDMSTANTPGTGGPAGAPDFTRWHSEPVIGAVTQGTALPDAAIPLATFAVSGGSITASSVTTAGRQYSGLRLPGPNATSTATLTNRNDGSSDGAVLAGTLTMRRDAAAVIGPALTLTNASAAFPGGTTAAAAIDFNNYDPGSNAPGLRIQAIGDGNGSSHLAILTKTPGAVTNALAERLRITSAGVAQFGGAASFAGAATIGGQPLTVASTTFTADNSTEIFTATAHGLQTGDGPLRVSNSGGALPTGLTTGTDYWAIALTANTFQLATSFADAIAGVFLAISTNGTGTQSIVSTVSTVRATDTTVSRSLTVGGHASVGGGLTVGGTLTHEMTWQHSIGFALPDGSASLSLGVAGTTSPRLSLLGSTGDNILPLSIPVGTITKWSVTLSKASVTGTITARLYECLNANGVAPTQIGSTQSNNANNPGAITLGQTGLMFGMTAGREYFIVVNGGGTIGDQVTSFNVAVTST